MIEIGRMDQVFVLTGAGVSAESGLPTFRGAGGIWEGHRVEEVASPIAWARDPEMVWRFYSWRREIHKGVKPNAAHVALAEMEARLGERFFLCTQNVDRLHEAAGPPPQHGQNRPALGTPDKRRIVHMHGELFKSRCERECGRPPFADEGQYKTKDAIPRCECGGMIRPHICWFGETPFEMARILEQLSDCSIFLCVGSSGVVHPAASFVRRARMAGARTYYVGPEEPANAPLFDQCFWGKAGEVLPELIRF